MLRLRVPIPARWWSCPASSAATRRSRGLILEAFRTGLVVEASASTWAASVRTSRISCRLEHGGGGHGGSRLAGAPDQDLDIGGGFPVRYDRHVKPSANWPGRSTRKLPGCFPETRRSRRTRPLSGGHRRDRSPASSAKPYATARLLLHRRQRYHTFSGIIFDHCPYHLKAFRKGKTEICAVFGQTCDGLDTISQAEELPELAIEELVTPRTSALTVTLPRPGSTASPGAGRARERVAALHPADWYGWKAHWSRVTVPDPWSPAQAV